MNEKVLERKLIAGVKKLGGKALKFHSPYETGWPDRIVLLRGRTWWVELKSTGAIRSPRQRIVHWELEKLGFAVWLISSETALEAFIEMLEVVKNTSK